MKQINGSISPAFRPVPGVRKPGERSLLVGSLPQEVAGDDGDALRWLLHRTQGRRLLAIPGLQGGGWRDDVCAGTTHSSGMGGHPRELSEAVADRADTLRTLIGIHREVRRQAAVWVPGCVIPVPLPLTWALATYGTTEAVLRRGRSVEPVVADVRCLAECGTAEEMVFQLTIPVCEQYLRDAVVRRSLLVWGARQITQILSATSTVRWIIHVCPIGAATPTVMTWSVALLNAVARRLSWHNVDAYLGMLALDRRPPEDADVYQPLGRLDKRVRVVAGVVSRYAGLQRCGQALFRIEEAMRRPVLGVGTACTLRHHSVQGAQANIALACALADQGWELWELTSRPFN